jgi:hypothetical protein
MEDHPRNSPPNIAPVNTRTAFNGMLGDDSRLNLYSHAGVDSCAVDDERNIATKSPFTTYTSQPLGYDVPLLQQRQAAATTEPFDPARTSSYRWSSKLPSIDRPAALSQRPEQAGAHTSPAYSYGPSPGTPPWKAEHPVPTGSSLSLQDAPNQTSHQDRSHQVRLSRCDLCSK